mmetsp:Transcript_72214/g.187478  ORF Transcript_72214/g.187478 Transcript_72214/m.187478 type:complete len:282 (+) Transcript_72214:519-1364(+)
MQHDPNVADDDRRIGRSAHAVLCVWLVQEAIHRELARLLIKVELPGSRTGRRRGRIVVDEACLATTAADPLDGQDGVEHFLPGHRTSQRQSLAARAARRRRRRALADCVPRRLLALVLRTSMELLRSEAVGPQLLPPLQPPLHSEADRDLLRPRRAKPAHVDLLADHELEAALRAGEWPQQVGGLLGDGPHPVTPLWQQLLVLDGRHDHGKAVASSLDQRQLPTALQELTVAEGPRHAHAIGDVLLHQGITGASLTVHAILRVRIPGSALLLIGERPQHVL